MEEDLPPSRIYIGGLSNSVTPVEIKSRFASYAEVRNVEIINAPLTGMFIKNVTIRGFPWLWVCRLILQKYVFVEKMYI